MGGGCCELCGEGEARIYCESDQAKLCWECDAQIHSANFLVAKHTRVLLCHVCSLQTPWKSSGPKLGPTTVSICTHCYTNDNNKTKKLRENQELVVQGIDDEVDDQEDEDDDYGGEFDDSDFDTSDDDEEEEGENQVVPWSPHEAPPSPPGDSSSSCEEYSGRFLGSARDGVLGFKSLRDDDNNNNNIG